MKQVGLKDQNELHVSNYKPPTYNELHVSNYKPQKYCLIPLDLTLKGQFRRKKSTFKIPYICIFNLEMSRPIFGFPNVTVALDCVF